MGCDTDDLWCQLRQHTIPHFGDLLFKGDAGADALRTAIKDLTARWSEANDGATWPGDPVPPQGFWRELIHIPRCTDVRSLYLFLLLDTVCWLLVVKIVRWLVYCLWPPSPNAALRVRVVNYTSLVVGAVLCSYLMVLLGRRMPGVTEPHLFFTLALTAYLYLANQVDVLVPDLPLPAWARNGPVSTSSERLSVRGI